MVSVVLLSQNFFVADASPKTLKRQLRLVGRGIPKIKFEFEIETPYSISIYWSIILAIIPIEPSCD
jgi:hypothetical protein